MGPENPPKHPTSTTAASTNSQPTTAVRMDFRVSGSYGPGQAQWARPRPLGGSKPLEAEINLTALLESPLSGTEFLYE